MQTSGMTGTEIVVPEPNPSSVMLLIGASHIDLRVPGRAVPRSATFSREQRHEASHTHVR